MNILVVSHEYPPIGGGGANACMFLTKGYAKRGHKVTLVTVWYEDLEVHEKIDGVEIFRVQSRRSHKEHCSFQEMFDFIMKALPMADNLERKIHFDICQVFFGIPSGPIGYWLKKRYGLPYIIRFGGGDIPGFQDRFKFVYKIISPAVKVIWKNASALIANSEGLRQFALKFYNEKPIDVIYNGVDAEGYYPDYSKRNSKRINLLFVSRLIERKGLQFIIPELKRIQQQTGKDIFLTIVGDGPYRTELEKLVDEYNVRDMVEFVGQKDKAELLCYYQAGDIFVFPSKREGMPNAVLEAMACGLPVVMTPCEGSSELVEENGEIVEVADMEKCLAALINDVNRMQHFGVESRSRVVKFFSWNEIVNQYIIIMEKIVGK